MRFFTLLCGLSLAGCNVFDPELYQDADGGPDAATLPVVALADRCTDDEVPTLEPSPDPRLATTADLADNFRNDVAACTGRTAPGNDGFFRIDMRAGEKWHFHLKLIDSEANPAVYILRNCDERACSATTG